MDANTLRITLVHDWLTGMRGGEKCLEVFCRLYPDSPLLTLLHASGSLSPAIEKMPIVTSYLQRVPFARRTYRHLLPLMPGAVERLRVPASDVVLSFSHCVAKGIQPPLGTPHVCYCFTPMRYAWQLREEYLASMGIIQRTLARPLLRSLRELDRATSDRVTQFVAISRTIQRRIWECYARESTVIYPPVDVEFYHPRRLDRDDYFLVVSALVPYKRVDLAVAACTKLHKRLVVIGSGPERKRLEAQAGSTVSFLGWQANDVIRDHLCRCRALLFPGVEDFGIVPVEANACGTPVIALAQGGATETIVPYGSSAWPTGWWFLEQSIDGMIDAVERFERIVQEFDARACRRQALTFAADRFERSMLQRLHEAAGRGGDARRQAA